jgi:hypothetical protein
VTYQLKTSRFALKVDDATDIVRDLHLITSVRYVLKKNIEEDCKRIDDRATSLEVFNINEFLEEYERYWDNCIGLCTDGAQYLDQMQDFTHW